MVDVLCSYTELKPIHKLTPHPENPHIHSDEQIDRLAKLIDYQGIRHPVIVSKRSGFIVAGHGRLAALKKLNVSDVPIDYQDFADEAQEYEFIVSDNAIGKDEWAALDVDLIKKKIDILPIKIPMLGLKDFEIKKIEPQSDEDEIPETPVDPISKLGDLYEIGSHRLLCGDSTDILQVEKLMSGEKADMVFTDPPYGYQYKSNHQSKHEMLKNDDKILDFLPCAYNVMEDNSCIYLCGSHQTIDKWKPLVDKHFIYKNLIVWKKNNWSMGDLAGAFAGQHELIIFAHKGRVEIRGERDRDVWEFERDPPQDHPTQKPIPLIEFAITKTSDMDHNILDLFGGSGSTLIACEKTNRKCFMMELDPHYIDVIVSRWCKYTGQTKIKRNGEEVIWNG